MQQRQWQWRWVLRGGRARAGKGGGILGGPGPTKKGWEGGGKAFPPPSPPPPSLPSPSLPPSSSFPIAAHWALTLSLKHSVAVEASVPSAATTAREWEGGEEEVALGGGAATRSKAPSKPGK